MMKIRPLLGTSLILGVLSFVSGGDRISNSHSGKANDGKWVVSALPDQKQNFDTSVPVAVVRVVSGLDEPDAAGKITYSVKEVIVENRSSKSVASVTLHWRITPLNKRQLTLTRGELSPHILKSIRKTLNAGLRQTLRFKLGNIHKLLEAIPNVEQMPNEFAVIIGVSEVVFEDGTVWKEEMTEVNSKSTATF